MPFKDNSGFFIYFQVIFDTNLKHTVSHFHCFLFLAFHDMFIFAIILYHQTYLCIKQLQMKPLPPIINHEDPLRPYTPLPKPKSKQLGKAKKIGAVTFLIGALFFSLLIIVAGIMENKIGRMVVKEANKQLKTKLVVQNFSISLITGFPKVSAQLQGVFLNDAFGSSLLKARTMSLQFSLFNIFSDNIIINSIVIKDGILVLKTDSKGRTNYDIVKPSVDKKSSDVELSINNATLQNVRFLYINALDKQNADLTIKSGRVSGKFGSDVFTLRSSADLMVASLGNNGQKFLHNKPLSYDARIAVNMVKNIYQFENVSLKIAAIPLQIKGLVQLVPQKGTFINVIAENKEATVANLFQLLPPQYLVNFKDFQSSGNFNFKTTIKGLTSKTQTPHIQAIVHFKNGRITSPKMKQSFDNLSFDVAYDNKKSVLDIPNCQATFAGNPLRMRLKLLNLNNPSVSFNMNGALPMSLAFGLLNNPQVTESGGIVRCDELKINGRYADMTSKKALQAVQASGNLALEKATFKINGEPIAADGILNFNNNGIYVQNFNVKGAGSDATFTGNFTNWLPVILSDSTQMTDLDFQARLDAERLDIGRLIALSKPQPQRLVPQSYYYAAKGLPMPQYRKQFPILNRMKGRFESNIKSFYYNKISGRNFRGSLDFTGNDLILRGSTNAMGGAWDIDGKMELGYRPHLFTKLITRDVNLMEFFRQCENFNQDVLKSENISGKLTSHIAINAYWDEKFKFLMDKLYVLADVNATEGALTNFKMLENFSTFIKIKDLKQIKFTNLQNQFEIYRQTLHIPTMFIQSNALNLEISGDHTFNQEINYNIVVNAAQVLINRFKLFNPRLDPQADQRNGLFNLYYNVSGNIDNFKFSSDKDGVKASLAASEYRKDEIRVQLSKYFDHVLQ